MTPLPGRVISVQKYGHNDKHGLLEISEIFLDFYSVSVEYDLPLCLYGEREHFDQCELREQFKGKGEGKIWKWGN